MRKTSNWYEIALAAPYLIYIWLQSNSKIVFTVFESTAAYCILVFVIAAAAAFLAISRHYNMAGAFVAACCTKWFRNIWGSCSNSSHAQPPRWCWCERSMDICPVSEGNRTGEANLVWVFSFKKWFTPTGLNCSEKIFCLGLPTANCSVAFWIRKRQRQRQRRLQGHQNCKRSCH